MDIDFSPLQESTDSIFLNLIFILFVPLVIPVIIGIILKKLKVSSKLIGTIVSLLYIYCLIKLVIIMDL
jgi:hypothetical protein